MRKQRTTRTECAPEAEARLEELEGLAAKLGVEIHYADLSSASLLGGDETVTARSGSCRIGNKQLIVVDRRFTPQQRVAFLLAEIGKLDLENHFLPPWMREKIHGDSDP